MAAAMQLHRHRDPLRPPEAPGLGRGMLFALAAHIALVVAISINVQWRTKVLPTAEAELWSAVPQAAAPKEVLPPPEPEPKPEPVKAKPDPTPPKPQEPTPEEIKQQRDAEIAVAKAKEEKKRKQDEEKRLAEQEEQKKQKALKEKAEKAEKEKQEKLDKQKADEKAKADKLREKAEQDKLDKLKEAKAQKEAAARLEAQRQENIKRMMGMAGASGGENARGTAQKSSGPSSSYGGRVVARVRPNITYADNPAGNPAAEVEVRLAPDGTIIGKRLIKSSGLPEWDNAVLRAIDKTEQLPRDVDGSVPSTLVISFRPRD